MNLFPRATLTAKSIGAKGLNTTKLLLALLLLSATGATRAAEVPVESLLNDAQKAGLSGDNDKALNLANRAVQEYPKNPQCYYVRGRLHANAEQPQKAIADFEQALKMEPRAAEIYALLGSERFKLSQFKQSVADFDKFAELVPKQAPQLWQRGISQYYAGDYKRGREQFESHQTVNSHDVENAVWHFLCIAKLDGIEKARAALIPIQGDARIPMMRVHALFAGKATPAEVLSAVGDGDPGRGEKAQRNFYAHLYIGLYYVAEGNEPLAREYIEKAAEVYPMKHYMGDVARVHARLLRQP